MPYSYRGKYFKSAKSLSNFKKYIEPRFKKKKKNNKSKLKFKNPKRSDFSKGSAGTRSFNISKQRTKSFNRSLNPKNKRKKKWIINSWEQGDISFSSKKEANKFFKRNNSLYSGDLTKRY